MNKRLVLVALTAMLVAACNGNNDNTSTSTVVVDPLGDLSVTTVQTLDMPPTDGNLPVDLLPPQ
jgi:hypothetical protein